MTARAPGPDFIGIGTRRCASSRMHQVLNAHPQVQKPTSGLHVFSEARQDNSGGYQSAFPAGDTDGEGKVRVDLSVSYLYPEYAASCAAAIAAQLPHVRLFATLRDPVARAYSDYMRSIMLKEIDPQLDFIAACEAYPVYIERSRYLPLFQPYWDHFGPNSVKLFLYEEMRRDPAAFYTDVAAYFGIDPVPFMTPAKGETGHAHAVRSQGLQRVILSGKKTMRRAARAMGMNDAWTGVTRVLQPAYQKLLRLNGREVKITDAEIAYASDRLGADTRAFMAAADLRDTLDWR